MKNTILVCIALVLLCLAGCNDTIPDSDINKCVNFCHSKNMEYLKNMNVDVDISSKLDSNSNIDDCECYVFYHRNTSIKQDEEQVFGW